MAKQELFGTPEPALPIWANKGTGTVGSLSQRFLDRYGAKPKMAGGGWLGDFGPGDIDPVPKFNRPRSPLLTTSSPDQMPDLSTLQTPGSVNVTGSTLPLPDISRRPGIDWTSVSSGAKDMVPFISNIANAFRRPPMPARPGMAGSITLNRLDNSNERANIDTTTRAADLAADRGLYGNTAAAYKAANLATKLHAYGDSYSRENNANTQIANEQAQYNSQIQRENLAKTDAYNDKVVEAKLAQQRAQSANLANASDKWVAIQNAKAERELKEREFTEASRLFNPGVAARYESYNKNPAAFWAQQQQEEAQREEEERKLNTSSRQVPKGTASTPSGKFGGRIGGKSMASNRVSSMRKVYR